MIRTIGIAIDPWKLDIFKKHLTDAGFQDYEVVDTSTIMVLIKVKTDRAFKLQTVVEAAQLECRKTKN